ncbi:hypothetical protein GJ496_001995 [Pomphorhynchus laevis]|nr:hypothetical protein GJ496_001995 [Pomphorhynchus laevis]
MIYQQKYPSCVIVDELSDGNVRKTSICNGYRYFSDVMRNSKLNSCVYTVKIYKSRLIMDYQLQTNHLIDKLGVLEIWHTQLEIQNKTRRAIHGALAVKRKISCTSSAHHQGYVSQFDFKEERICNDCAQDWLTYKAKLHSYNLSKLRIMGKCVDRISQVEIKWEDISPCGYCIIDQHIATEIITKNQIHKMSKLSCYHEYTIIKKVPFTFCPSYFTNWTFKFGIILEEYHFYEYQSIHCFNINCTLCLEERLSQSPLKLFSRESARLPDSNEQMVVCSTYGITFRRISDYMKYMEKLKLSINLDDISYIGNCSALKCNQISCLMPLQKCLAIMGQSYRPVCINNDYKDNSCLKYKPVCGTNGRTYINKCELNLNVGIKAILAYKGPCRRTASCFDGCLCESNQLCLLDKFNKPVCVSTEKYIDCAPMRVTGDNGQIYRSYCQLHNDILRTRQFIHIKFVAFPE